MNIIINQQTKDIPDDCTVQQLISQVLNMPAGGLAIAIDQNIISQSDWATYILQPSDKVMLIRATQGG